MRKYVTRVGRAKNSMRMETDEGSTHPQVGLSEAVARDRLAAEGENALPRGQRRKLRELVVETISEPMILLLVGAAVLYFFLGQARDAFLLVGSVIVVIILELVQNNQAERALEMLRRLSEPTAEVLRGGRRHTVSQREVVRGDWLVLAEGRRIAADARLREGEGIETDESLLTGESLPVRKETWDGRQGWKRPGGDGLPFLYAQTLIVRGQGLAEVVATGARTEVSQIARALASVDPETPVLRRQTRALLFGAALAGVVLCVLVALLTGITQGAWGAGILAGIALAIAMVPEEIPVILTVYNALGARRIADQAVLTRRFESIGTLGATTVLCTDKTGTLTENRMQLSLLLPHPSASERVGAAGRPISPSATRLLRVAARACDPRPTDPTDSAIVQAASEGGDAWARVGPVVRAYSFRREVMAVGNAERDAEGPGLTLSIKGAPEALLRSASLDERERLAWEAAITRWTSEGLRLIGVASCTVAGPNPPDSLLGLRLDFLGMVGLVDPLRPAVPQAVRQCREAGIRVVLITGDHPGTARAIAGQADIERPDRVLTGEAVARMGEEEFRRQVGQVNVFARFRPEEKLRLVQGLQHSGEVVAMTGDGVNDAPALRAAHVGIAMGGRGTDVAREAAALVLLDDSFPTLVRAIRLGRRIYDNIRKGLRYVLSVHVAIAGMALLPVVLGLPLVLFPIEIVFLEFVVDPAMAIAFESEPEEPDIMHHPPRSASEPIGSARLIAFSLTQGAISLGAIFGVYWGALEFGHAAVLARTLAFASLLVSNLVFILVHRLPERAFWELRGAPNRPMLFILAWGAGILFASLYVPVIATLFGFAPPPLPDLAVALGLSAASVLWVEPAKLVRRWLHSRAGAASRAAPAAGAR